MIRFYILNYAFIFALLTGCDKTPKTAQNETLPLAETSTEAVTDDTSAEEIEEEIAAADEATADKNEETYDEPSVKGAPFKLNLKTNKPSIIDLFSAIIPRYEDYKWFYDDFMSSGARNSKYNTYDVKNGYIRYETPSVPGAVIEFCYWNYNDKRRILLGINHSNEQSEEAAYLSSELIFIVYNKDTDMAQELDPANVAPALQKVMNPKQPVDYRVDFPRSGKDIKFELFKNPYHKKGKSVLKWDGNGRFK